MLRFADALARGLLAAGVEITVARPAPFFGRLRPARSGLGKWLGYLDKFLLFPPRLRSLAAQAELVHIVDHSNAMYVRQAAGRPHLVTCNDLLAVRSALGEFPQNPTGWSGRILQRWIASGLRCARRITCISAATRADVIRLFPGREETVSVTYMGHNFPYAPVKDPAAQGAPAEPYLLHVGGDQWYKNRKGVLDIYRELRRQRGDATPGLILVGPPIAETIPGVEVRQKVDNTALAALYSGAELLLFPSLEEGFGWPPIEAQACGCRVLTTRKAPMTETCGETAFYLEDPTDAMEGAAAIRQALAQPAEERAKLIAAGLANAARFSTERMISEYLAIYRSLVGGAAR